MYMIFDINLSEWSQSPAFYKNLDVMATTGIALRSKTLPKQQTISEATINFDLEKRLIRMLTRIPLFRETLSKKKNSTKVHGTRSKGDLGIHWNFAYWLRGNVQLFPLKRPFICSFTFTVACL